MKKLAIAFLALAMVLTTVLVPILADEDATNVVGYSADRVTKVNVADLTDLKDYDPDNVAQGYKIYDAAGLVKFSELVNGGQSFAGCNIYLTKDIDMSEVTDFKPIGSMEFTVTGYYANGNIQNCRLGTAHPFSGTFNGHGHVIDNLHISVDASEVLYAGFFGYASNAVLMNFVLGPNCSIEHTTYNDWGAAGAICGRAPSCTFDNIYNAASVETNGPHAAGFFGRGNGTVKNSTNAGDMTAMNSAGGFGGFPDGASTFENCRNTGTICGDQAAGIMCRLRGTFTIKGCINNGRIEGKNYAGALGGLADQDSGSRTFENCINYGELVSENGQSGQLSYNNDKATPATVTNCENKYGVEEDDYVAPTIVCDPEQAEDVGDPDVTAFVTTAAPYKPEIGTNTNPTGDEVGYSSARIEEVDTTTIVNIKNFNEYPDESCYKITDVAGFQALDEAIFNWYSFGGATIYLANDIDFSSVQGFTPLSYDIENLKHVNGSVMFYFSGTLDGQGEAICNLKMNSVEKAREYTEEELNGQITDYTPVVQKDGTTKYKHKEAVVCVGLFGCAAGTFKNLIIDDSCEFSYNGTVTNMLVASLVAKQIGALNVDNVWNRANVSGGSMVGFVTGRTGGKYEVTNCTNSGNIKGTGCVGGFFGYDGSGGTITNSRNVGNVERITTHTAFQACSAGFVARARGTVTIEGCINNGTISGGGNCGAFLGTVRSNGNVVKDSINYGPITATAEGGLTGISYAAFEYDQENGEITKTYGSVTPENVSDRTGQQDSTLLYEDYTPDFTEEEDGEIVISTTEATQATTKKPTKADSTTAATTAKTTAATTAPSTVDEDDEGCGSTVIGGLAVIMLVSGAALTLFKKKED